VATEAPANGVATTLASAISSTSATTCSLTSATGFTNAQYHCLIVDPTKTNFELVEATGLSGTTLTIVRAAESWNGSATAYTFASGSTIAIVTSVQSVINLAAQSMTPANGYGITGNTGLTPTPAVGLTSAAGTITSGVVLPHAGTVTKIMDTASLGVGTWLLTFTAGLLFGNGGANTGNAQCAFTAAVDTATATFAGVTTSFLQAGFVGQYAVQETTLTMIVTVTVAGTVKLSGAYTDTTNDGLAYSNVTGYTAVRIA
jgi:hypothetical protein